MKKAQPELLCLLLQGLLNSMGLPDPTVPTNFSLLDQRSHLPRQPPGHHAEGAFNRGIV